jgi:hypothetical protein
MELRILSEIILEKREILFFLLILVLISCNRQKLLILWKRYILLLILFLIWRGLIWLIELVLFYNNIISKLIAWSLLSFLIFQLFEIICSEWWAYLSIVIPILMLMVLLLIILMNKLLLEITHLILSAYYLARVIYLIIVMIVFLFLDALRWLPTTWLTLITTLSISKSLSFLLLNGFIIIWIIKLSCILKLILLQLIRWWIKNNLLIRHHHFLWHLLLHKHLIWWKLLHKSLLIWWWSLNILTTTDSNLSLGKINVGNLIHS